MDSKVIPVPERHDNIPANQYDPTSEFDLLGGADDRSLAMNPDASWEQGDPFDPVKPTLKSQYIDSLRPGSETHKKLKSKADLAQKKLDDIESLLSGPGSRLFDPVHAATWDLTKPTESERKSQLRTKRQSARASLATIHKAIDELDSKVSAHDSGVPWMPEVGLDKTGPEAVTNLDLHTRYQSGDVPVEEFGTNDRLLVDKKADTHSGKIKNFFGAPDHIAGDSKNVEKQRDELVALAKIGQRSKHWYDYTSKLVNRVTRGNKDEARKLAGALAITSANNSLDGNLACALRAYNTYRTALRLGQYIPIKAGHGDVSDAKLDGLFYADHHTVGGRKVNNFFHNIMKLIDPSLTQGATNDLWMKRIFGYDIKDGKTGEGPANIRDDQYSYMQNMLHQVAHKLTEETGSKWSPDQVQAALWTAGREAHNADKKIEIRSGIINKKPDFEGNLIGTHRDHEEAKDQLRKAVNEAMMNGIIDRDTHEAYGHLINDGEDSLSDDPLGVRDSLHSMNSKLNTDLGYLVRSREAEEPDIEKTLIRENAERERERLARNVQDPQTYDFVDSAHKVLPSALNVSMIPAKTVHDMDGMNDEAPYYIKAHYANEAAPIIQEVLGRLGVPRSVHGDMLGYGDFNGMHHPLFGIGLNTPIETVGDAKKVHDHTDKMNRLATAMMGYIFRQPQSSYTTFGQARTGDGVFDVGLANTSFFRIKTGKVGMREWKAIVNTRDAMCDRLGISPEDIQIVPSVSNGGHGVSFVNHNDNLSNEEFQKATRLMMKSADIVNRGLSFDHLALSNKGARINEPWTDRTESGDRRESGANYRDAIRGLGGDAAVAYADHIYESKVKPLIDKYSKWRELVGREGYGDLDEGSPFESIGRVYASEGHSGRRDQSIELAERIRHRAGSASRVELAELLDYASTVANGGSLIRFGMRGVLLGRVCQSLAQSVEPNT